MAGHDTFLGRGGGAVRPGEARQSELGGTRRDDTQLSVGLEDSGSPGLKTPVVVASQPATATRSA